MRSIRRLTLVALLASAIVCGCESGSSEGPAADFVRAGAPAPAGTGFVALYAPPVDVVPYPNDLYNPTGTRLAVPVKITSPLVAALNTLDGFSTTAVISAPFNAPLDPASLIPWNPGYRWRRAPPRSSCSTRRPARRSFPASHYSVRVVDGGRQRQQRSRDRAAAPARTAHAVRVHRDEPVRSTAGVAAGADLVFGAVRDAHLVGQHERPGPTRVDALVSGHHAPDRTPRSASASPVTASSSRGACRRSRSATCSTSSTPRRPRAPRDSFPPALPPRSSASACRASRASTRAIIEVPYYGDPANPLTSFWVSSSLAPPNVQNPTPIARVPNRRIPLLATLPNTGSGRTQPRSGWPVVIFQHGITLNRTVMFAMADAFAQAGFAVVAIDLPLHGVTDTASPFYQGANSPFGNNERHFNLDNVGATGIFTPDGQIDNGWQILNVAQPAQRARSHPPSRCRLDCADAHAAGPQFPGRRCEPRSRRQPHPLRRHLPRQHHQRCLLGVWTRPSRPPRSRAPQARGPRS